MDERWDEHQENGITLGPEATLHREIQKSKSLKIELLRLRDENERLQSQNRILTQKMTALEQTPHGAEGNPSASPSLPSLILYVLSSTALALWVFFFATQ
jgi:hypothetical protein